MNGKFMLILLLASCPISMSALSSHSVRARLVSEGKLSASFSRSPSMTTSDMIFTSDVHMESSAPIS